MHSFQICVGIFVFMIGYGYAFSKNKDLAYSAKHVKQLLIVFWSILFVLAVPASIETLHSAKLGGMFIQHGYCTVIAAQSIGENFWVNQNVTIAYSGNGCIIGNNVHIASDANIVGGISIGDNVTIGAGTTVVRDVPSDTLVVSQKPRYIPKVSRE